MTALDPRAFARLDDVLNAYENTLTPEQQAELVLLRLSQGGVTYQVVVADGRCRVDVTVMLDRDGTTVPHTVLRLDGGRIGLCVVAGEVIYIDS